MEDDVIARVNKEDDVIAMAKFFLQVIARVNKGSLLFNKTHT